MLLHGIGKTTLIKQCNSILQEKGVITSGFYTEELRVNGKRTGFDVVTLDKQRAVLSRIDDNYVPGIKSQPRVGQYTVKVSSFESVAIPSISIKALENYQVVVIDEIGKMELFSPSFIRAVKSVMKIDKTIMFATIPVLRGKPIPFVEEIRHHKNTKLFDITKENRDTIKEDIVKALLEGYS